MKLRGAWFKLGFKRYFFTQEISETWYTRRLQRQAVSGGLKGIRATDEHQVHKKSVNGY